MKNSINEQVIRIDFVLWIECEQTMQNQQTQDKTKRGNLKLRLDESKLDLPGMTFHKKLI